MKLAVILVNWHSEAQTLRRVAAIRAWRAITPQLLVVDNEATDTSRSALSQVLSEEELICSESNEGYGGGNNRGIACALGAGAQYVLLLNPDAEITEGTTSGLLERLEAHPEIGILGPVLRERQDGGVHCYIGGKDISHNLATRILADDSSPSDSNISVAEVDYVPGAVFLARRKVFEHVGLFDERFFFGGETADFCARARAMGYRSFVDLEAMADHETRATPKDVRETLYTYYSLRNRMLYVRKHGSGTIAGQLSYWAARYMLELAKAVAKGEFGKARAIALALVDGLCNRTGSRHDAFI